MRLGSHGAARHHRHDPRRRPRQHGLHPPHARADRGIRLARGVAWALRLQPRHLRDVHLRFVPPLLPRRTSFSAEPPTPATGGARRVLRETAFWCFVATMLMQGAVSTGIPIHLIPLLVERGFTLARCCRRLFADRAGAGRRPARHGCGRALLQPADRRGRHLRGLGTPAFALLPFVPAGSWLVFAFAALYGASNGMVTIVRALLPPRTLRARRLRRHPGHDRDTRQHDASGAPFAFGALWAWWGSYGAVLALSFAMALGSLAAFAVTLLFARGR